MLIAVIALTIAVLVMAGAIVRVHAQLTDTKARHAAEHREMTTLIRSLENDAAAVRAILDGVDEGLLALDSERRVVFANARFIEMFDMTESVVGKPLGEAIRAAAVFNACDAALDGEEMTERFAISNGADRTIEVHARPLVTEQIAVVARFIDVTRIEHLEDVRRNFISDFSHEVRTPLAGLATAVETYDLASHAMSAEDEQQLRRIMSRQLARLQRLVDDLSELSRIESGELTLHLRVVDLRSLIEDLCEEFADRAAQRSSRFDVTGGSAVVNVDPVRMQQAFSNLMDNAIKYGAEKSTIDIRVEADGDAGIVRISDHGEGLPPGETERIFNRFYRVDKSRSQDVTGTGLGLAITRHLVLLHGGTIDVESESGVGATFIVRLPLYTQ